MKINQILFTLLIFNVCITSAHAYVYIEDVCNGYGGDSICVPPELPRVTSDWTYSIANPVQGRPSFFSEKRENGEQYFLDKLSNWSSGVSPYGDWMKATCNECDLQGNTTDSDIVGTVSDYWGTYPAGRGVAYSGKIATRQTRQLKGSSGFILGQFVRSRRVSSFRCNENQEAVHFADANNNNTIYPFLCEIPPENCDDCDPINNPIKTNIGNPINIATGNKNQTETDWISSNSRLKISRKYNSMNSDTGLISYISEANFISYQVGGGSSISYHYT